ncbi:peptidase domain-containing protein [Desulfonema limicola]|uniref:Peptidase domain-containing protein n=1 Tax=Desulfonema limicola TaxID=45656 RepID=A0A975B9E2_9BACT|nr:peptidoglycan endopeptidase [Desulfonema limicola]QTA81346.1 peptidase domain-containing protein [Desulfonema limicola]
MNKLIHHILYPDKILALIIICFFTCIISENSHASAMTHNNMENMEVHLSLVAEHYIGIPYKFGGDPEKAGAADNSHLLCDIYDKAAKQAGLKFIGYMPMQYLLDNTVQVQKDELKVGDMVVLYDGHAAMIYKFFNKDDFYLIYASFIKEQVISFHSKNAVYEAYWLKNLKGFYRLSQKLFTAQD